MQNASSKTPTKLAGTRVLDLTRLLPGPYIARMMADNGAEVIKVESPDGDPSRKMGRPVAGITTYFRETNSNKKSIVLDLKRPEGRELLLELAARSDVFVESFRPGVVDRLGINYAEVKKRSDGIVYCSISAFGQTGPRRETPAHDIGVQALTGFLAVGCDAGGTPILPGVPAADMAAGMTALSSILMALLRKQQTGLGDYIDISMFDSLLAWTPHFADRVFVHGAAPVSSRERWWGGAAFYNIYRTADDRHITLGGTEDKFVEAILTALGGLHLMPVAKQPPGHGQKPLKDFLTAMFLTKTQGYWIGLFDSLDAAFAPVFDLKQAYQDPQTIARRTILDESETGTRLASPTRFDAEPGYTTGQAPGLGEHTDQILADLGYDEVARRRFYQTGVCGKAIND